LSGPRGDELLYRHAAARFTALAESDPSLVAALFQRIEREGHLAKQAAVFGGFDAGIRDLEEHLLPFLALRRDWERFVHYATIACNLRLLIESLDSPRMLAALATRRLDLAETLTGRLTVRGERLRARATVLRLLDRDHRRHAPTFARLRSGIEDDLDAGL